MTEDPVAVELRQFLSEHVETHEKLEALLWFLAHANEASDCASLARQLNLQEGALGEALDGLVGDELLSPVPEAPGMLRYRPASSELDAAVRRLAHCFDEDRLRVIRLLTENSLARLRGSTLRAFADCFLIGRPKKRG